VKENANFLKTGETQQLTFLPDVDVKSVGPEKNNPEKPFSKLSN